MYTIEMYQRKDGKWAWRLRADNGKIVAVDGAQGYSRRTDAEDTAAKLFPNFPIINA